MATKTRYPNIPRIGKSGRDIAALTEVAEILNGARGKDNLDRALTLRDFLSGNAGAGIINDAVIGIGNDYTPPGIIPGYPTQPTGFTATGAFNFIILQWDPAIFVGYAFTRIYRATTDDFGLAVQIATNIGPIFGDDVNPGESYYYWIRFTNTLSVDGPLNDTAGTFAETGIDPAYLIAQLSAQITENEFVQALNDRIDLIDVTAGGGLVSSLAQEVIDRAGADGNLQAQINTISAGTSVEIFIQATQPVDADAAGGVLLESSIWYDSDDGNRPYRYISAAWIEVSDQRIVDNAAAITTETLARESDVDAEAARIDLLIASTAVTDSNVAINTAGILTEENARTTAIAAEASRITTLEATAITLGDDIITNAADISTESSVRASEIGAEATRIDTLVAANVTSDGAISTNAAAIVTEANTRATEIGAEATRIDTLQVTVSNVEGTATDASDEAAAATAAVQTVTNVVIGPNSLSASYTLKFDVNGYVSGYTSYNDGTTSAIVFNVDTFAVGKLGTSDVLPFFVTGGNVYLDSAVIRNASISSAQIISLVAESITGFDVAYVEATLGDAWITNLMIGNFIQSNGYSVNGPGWQLQKDYGLTLRGPGGAIILQSRIDGGTALGAEIDNTQQNYSDVTGGPPSNADNTAANTGAMAQIDQITGVNISTYIQSLAVGNAQIGNAVITNAKIGDLAVDTVKIAGQAVTFPIGAFTAARQDPGTSWTTVQTVAMTCSGAPVNIAFNCTSSIDGANTSTLSVYARIMRGGTVVHDYEVVARSYQGIAIASTISFAGLDNPPAGVHSYTVQMYYTGTKRLFIVEMANLFALELKK